MTSLVTHAIQLPPVTVIDDEGNQRDYRNSLNDKFGVIVDYAVEQNMTEETSNLINQYVKVDVTDRHRVETKF